MSLCLFYVTIRSCYFITTVFNGNRTKRNAGAKLLKFLDYGEEFEKNLCAIRHFLLNRGQNVQEN